MGYLLRNMRLTARSVRAYSVYIENPGPDFAAAGAEVDTGGVWIDGKAIYSRVIDMGTLPNAASKSVNHNIVGLDTVVAPLGGVAVSGTGTHRTLPYVDNVLNDAITVEANATAVALITYADWTDHTGFIIIEYTRA